MIIPIDIWYELYIISYDLLSQKTSTRNNEVYRRP